MAGMVGNRPKFDPRWNRGYYGTDLHADTKYFGKNGMELITMIKSLRPKSKNHDNG